MGSDLVIALMVFFAIVFSLVVFAMKGQEPAKVPSQATVKPQAPTEEELLLAMSDSELLRKIAKHSEESARHLFFIRIGIAVIVFVLLGGFTFTFREPSE